MTVMLLGLAALLLVAALRLFSWMMVRVVLPGLSVLLCTFVAFAWSDSLTVTLTIFGATGLAAIAAVRPGGSASAAPAMVSRSDRSDVTLRAIDLESHDKMLGTPALRLSARLLDRLPGQRMRRLSAAEQQRVANAWAVMSEHAPMSANRLAIAKRSCDRLLTQPGTLSLDWIDARASVYHTFPNLVASYVRQCRTASPAAKASALETTLDSIEAIAAICERLLQRAARDGLAEIETINAHVRRKAADQFSI